MFKVEHVISDFCHGVNEVLAFLGYCTASIGS